ncbi:MAG: hypothetical protein ABIA78_00720 [archaeon]
MAKKEEKKSKLKDSTEGLGIAGFILGIISIIFAANNGIIVAVVGFILCMVQQKKSPMRLAKTGMILNIIGFILAIIIIILLYYVLRPLMEQAGFPVA